MKLTVKNLRIFIAIQLITLIVLAAFVFYKSRHVETINIDLADCSSEYAGYENGMYVFDETMINTENWEDALISDKISLRSGSYTLYISYECLADKMFSIYDGTNTNAYLRNDTGFLRSENDLEMFKFRTVADLDSFQIKIKYQPFGYLKIKGITIVSNNTPFKIAFFSLFVLFILIDLAYIKRDFLWQNRMSVARILAITFVTSLPLFIPRIASGHDLEFALLRIEGLYRGLQAGSFPVYIHDLSLKGCGYPLSVYYGDVFLYIAAMFRFIGFSVCTSWKLYILTVNLATAVIAFVCFDKMSNDRTTAALMAFAYTAAPYRLSDIYARAAAGEFTSITFYPLIALSLYMIYTKKEEGKRSGLYSSLLALGISAVLCTHVLSTLMLAFALVILAAVLFRRTFTAPVIKDLLSAALKTILISAAFLVPFLDYFFSVRVAINDTVSEDIKTMQFAGAYISDYLALDHSVFTGERIPYSPGLVLILALLSCIFIFLHKKPDRMTVFLALMSFFYLFISSNLFPWDALTSRLSLFRILAQVQLPSRYICFAIIFLTLLYGRCMDMISDPMLKRYLCILAMILMIVQISIFTGRYESEQKTMDYTNTSNIDTTSIGAGEYLRADSDMYTDNYGLISRVDNVSILSTDRSGNVVKVQCSSGESPLDVVVPKYNYKGYHAYDDNGNELMIKDGPNNLISVTVPPSYTGYVNVRFVVPMYWRIAWIVSLISLLFLAYQSIRSATSSGDPASPIQG